MFKRLTDLAYQRSKGQAFGFYIAYSAICFGVTFVLGMVIAVTLQLDVATNPDGEKVMRLIGALTAIFVSVGLGALILHRKNMLTGKGYAMLGLTFLLAAFIGGVVGMAITAYLTTWKPANGADAIPATPTPPEME